MGGHALRGAVTAWLTLIVLEAVARDGTGKVASLFADANRLIQRAFDPAVPAIPDRRNGTAAGYSTPAGLAGPYTYAPTLVPTGRRVGQSSYAT
jgi:hypothetical protein